MSLFFVVDLVTYQSHMVITITTNSVGLYQLVFP